MLRSHETHTEEYEVKHKKAHESLQPIKLKAKISIHALYSH